MPACYDSIVPAITERLLFHTVRLISFGMFLLLAACVDSGGVPFNSELETAIAGTVSAQATVFQQAGDPAGTPSTPIFCSDCETANVLRIVDGDTIETDIGRFQLFGADAPGPNAVCGAEATEFFRSLVSREVGFRYRLPLRDEHNTNSAYIYDSVGNNIDYQMIASGFAMARTRDGEQLDGPHEDALVAVEQSAKNGRAGCLWENFVRATPEPTATASIGPELTPTAAIESTESAQIPEETPEPTREPSSSPTATATIEPTATTVPPNPTPIPPPSATPEPTATAVPTAAQPTPSPTVLPTPTPLPTATPEPTATAAPTAIPPTPAPTSTHTPTPTVTPTPVPRLSIAAGTTPKGFANGTTSLNGARVVFDQPVGVLTVNVDWGDGSGFVGVTVIQSTGEIVASHVYVAVGSFLVEIKVSSEEGDSATASIIALVN